MKKMLLAVIILGILGITLPFILKIYVMDSSQWLHTHPSPSLSDSLRIGQKFVSKHNNLSKVDVLFATFSSHHQGKIVFHLRRASSASSKDLRTVSVAAGKIRDNQYQSFVFSPIKTSKNVTFFFFISSRNLEPKDIYIWWADTTPQKGAYVNDIPLKGDLVFKVYYKTALLHGIRTMLWRLSKNKPLYLKSPFFYAFLFSIYGIIDVVFMTVISKKI